MEYFSSWFVSIFLTLLSTYTGILRAESGRNFILSPSANIFLTIFSKEAFRWFLVRVGLTIQNLLDTPNNNISITTNYNFILSEKTN